jgi:phosphoglycolate phosphatase-like HAD superfamily hydrolase
MVGDAEKDMEFGRAIGCRTVRVDGGFTLKDAVDQILGS